MLDRLKEIVTDLCQK